MKLATIRTRGTTAAVRVDGDAAVETGDLDVGALLARPDWREHAATADGARHPLGDLDFAPVVPRPQKIFCVGLNYRSHITEMGRDIPQYPTVFAKFPAVLIGANDTLVLPAASQAVDWEGELAVVIGSRVRNVEAEDAAGFIAGYAVLNDVTARDWQHRTREWLQGKVFEATTPFGPYLVTSDETDGSDLRLVTEVDGETVQQAVTGDLVFDAAALVAYLSTIITLEPGDVIATGTPGGVGNARKPPRFLEDGSVLTTRIEGLGEARNHCVREKTDAA
ncbi:Ureidoglycolate lyase [Actinomadura rubteroloni]|uniref:Ureidoglycolate lyase n=1 Tax=Actinomadura rubteroloni TaxID=1926885 RepID=A0A2P4UDQ8_9ACTN|nr:fumarylacetoacetate hydrolase family protein [Actinomadura rubteroloni]POM23175.1 Ureidoglycolate lyase [Actinomadura rubteroloni]